MANILRSQKQGQDNLQHKDAKFLLALISSRPKTCCCRKCCRWGMMMHMLMMSWRRLRRWFVVIYPQTTTAPHNATWQTCIYWAAGIVWRHGIVSVVRSIRSSISIIICHISTPIFRGYWCINLMKVTEFNKKFVFIKKLISDFY